MTTKRRVPATKKATTSTTKRAATKRSTTAKRTTRRTTRTTRTTPRRRAGTATTLGAGAGTVIVAFLVGAPWPVRIALVVLVLLAGLGYLLWSRRS